MAEPVHFSYCTGCTGTFVCPRCKRVCGKCFEAPECDDWEDEYFQLGWCAECAHVEAERQREELYGGAA